MSSRWKARDPDALEVVHDLLGDTQQLLDMHDLQWLLTTTTHYSLLTAHCLLLLTTHYSLLTVDYSLLPAHL